MLLRRVSKHLSDQNWLAVALDFLVVIAGVFFAMQAENWYSARQDRANGDQLLRRLYNDYTGMEYVLQSSVVAIDGAFRQTDHLIKIHDGRDTDELEEDILYRIVGTSLQTTPPPQPIATQSEMMSSGQVRFIEDRQLLAAFNNFELRRAYTADSYDQISDTIQPIRREIYSRMALLDELNEEGDVVFGAASEIDIDWLLSDPEIYRSLTLMRRMQGQYLMQLQMLEAQAHDVVVALEEKLGVPGRHDEFLHADDVDAKAVPQVTAEPQTGEDS